MLGKAQVHRTIVKSRLQERTEEFRQQEWNEKILLLIPKGQGKSIGSHITPNVKIGEGKQSRETYAYLPRQYDPSRCSYSYSSHHQTLATRVQSSAKT